MTAYNSISEMMQSYAEQAVEAAREMDVTLDYQETSLQRLEQILARLYRERPISHGQAAPGEAEAAQREMDAMARVWGGYFGEVIRRCWGGEWTLESYPGTAAAVVALDIAGAKIFPVMKIYRRLTEGEKDNLWSFYQMVREKIQQRRKVQ